MGDLRRADAGRRRNSEGELRGHFTGHYLSASAQLYASMGDKEAKAKADDMVAELAKCQQKLGASGYLSAFPIGVVRPAGCAGKPVWAPFYTIHKIMAGMLDMYQLAGNKQALEVLEGMSRWADEWSASKTEEHMQDILNTEYGGMNEVLYNLAAATGNDRWAKAGDRFTKKRFFNPLALHNDELTGLHVNTHIPQVIGAARRYEISSDMRFHDVADYFWYEVTTARSYVTTGTSNGEGWLAQPRMLGAELKRSVATAECCCSYNMLKLARHLYSWTRDSGYFDYYERSLLNHAAGHDPAEDRATRNITCRTRRARGRLSTRRTNPSGAAPAAAWRSTPSSTTASTGATRKACSSTSLSRRNWIGPRKDSSCGRRRNSPSSRATTLTVSAAKAGNDGDAAADSGVDRSRASVKINGRAIDVTPTPGSYFTLNRAWKAGDKIEMTLPMHLSVEAMPDDPKDAGVPLRPDGAGGRSGERRADRAVDGGSERAAHAAACPLEVPSFQAARGGSGVVDPAGRRAAHVSHHGPARDVTLMPLNSIFGKRYSIYWQVS